MQSYISAGWIGEIMKRSGAVSGEWQLVLLNDKYQPEQHSIVTSETIPQSALIGVANVPIRYNDTGSQVLAAVESVSIANIGNMAPSINAIAIFSSLGVMAAYIGQDLLKRGFKVQEADGNLIIEFNKTCPALVEL